MMMAYIQARSGLFTSGVTYAGWAGPPNVGLRVGGTSVIAQQLQEGWELTERADGSAATFLFSLHGVTPVNGSRVELTYAPPNDYLFVGNLVQMEAESLEGQDIIWHCTAVGLKWLLDTHDLVVAHYEHVAVNTMVTRILQSFSGSNPAWRVGYCPSALGYLSMDFQDDPVSACLDRIVAAIGSGARWEVTPEYVVNVFTTYPIAALPTLTTVQTLRYSEDFTQARTSTYGMGKSAKTTAACEPIASTVISVTTVIQVSGTATVTTGAPHGLMTGQYVYISGASPLGYNGAVLVTVTGNTTFSYAVDTLLASPATGTIQAEIGFEIPIDDCEPFVVESPIANTVVAGFCQSISYRDVSAQAGAGKLLVCSAVFATPSTLPQGADVRVFQSVIDAAAMAVVGPIIGSSGLIQHLVRDEQLTATEAYYRATADVAQFKTAIKQLDYTVYDDRFTRAGRVVTAAITVPITVSGDFYVRSVTMRPYGQMIGAVRELITEISATGFTQRLAVLLARLT